MNELWSKLNGIINKYRINAIFNIGEGYASSTEVENAQIQEIEKLLKQLSHYRSVALFGVGGYEEYVGKYIKRYQNITYMIDNYTTGEKEGIPIINLNDSELLETIEAIVITSWNYHELFIEELKKVKYQGKIIDIPGYVLNKFPDIERPIYEYKVKNGRLSYVEINELEIQYYSTKEKTKKYEILKKIIYALFMIKDFLYAEKYIYQMEKDFAEFDEDKKYRLAIEESKQILKSCVKQKGEDVLFVHIIDSLSNELIDEMEWLRKISEKSIRIKNIILQYPVTHYAINTIFTGKTPFEIERQGEEVFWNESIFLKYLKKHHYSINIASGIRHIMDETKEINTNVKKQYPYFTITEAMFEGLSLWEQNKNKNIIVIHSCGEIHSSFYRTGNNDKLINCKNMTSAAQFRKQFTAAVKYVDEQLEYYNYFYRQTEMPMIFMGDHGISIDYEINAFLGTKRDMSRGLKELLNPAFVIHGSNIEIKERNQLISFKKIPQIIMGVLIGKINIEELEEDFIELQFLPGYNEDYCKKFMERGMWGMYEGFRGLRTKKEVYLVSATGKEIYYRPEEGSTQNLIDNSRYLRRIEKFREWAKSNTFPMDIFKMEKYKKHLQLLKQYDTDGYQIIVEQLSR